MDGAIADRSKLNSAFHSNLYYFYFLIHQEKKIVIRSGSRHIDSR